MQKRYDVTAIGNAIVDVVAQVDDSFLDQHHLQKSAMTLIDEEKAVSIYDAMPPSIEISGGSAANTVAGMANLGSVVAFIGKVKDDTLGKIFAHDLNAIGVTYHTLKASDGPQTARCLIAVTKDAARTMATYLGATRHIDEDDVDEDLIAQAKIVYLEGYLWDATNAKKAMMEAMKYAVKHQCKIAFTLSDVFCVERHKEEFLELVEKHIDILFSNEAEIQSLHSGMSLEAIIKHYEAQKDKIIIITRGDQGSMVIGNGTHVHVQADRSVNVVDTTGAGDLYAAGFLHGLSNGESLQRCAEIATKQAAQVITHLGARKV